MATKPSEETAPAEPIKADEVPVEEVAAEGEVEESTEFAGQSLSSDNYLVTTSEVVGNKRVEIRPAGWVGDGFVFPASRIKEVVALLKKVANLPEQQ